MDEGLAFDYVIVGGGSAGCVLAGRLSEDPAVRVALLEAGGDDRRWEVTVPAGLITTVPSRRCNWALTTEPQPGLNGRRGFQPRGKVLGGSSSINAMIYTRGQPEDYDAWAAQGAAGWGWADVLPWFRRAEANERGADALHGADGPLNVADLRSPNPVAARFVEAAVAAGWPRNADFNGAAQEGVGSYQVTQKNGERWNAARAYLHPAMARPNLRVFTGAQARRVLLDGGRATGVEVLLDGQAQTLHARREVLLAAGASRAAAAHALRHRRRRRAAAPRHRRAPRAARRGPQPAGPRGLRAQRHHPLARHHRLLAGRGAPSCPAPSASGGASGAGC